MSAESEKLLSDFGHARPWTGEQDVVEQKLRALIDRLESEKEAAETKLALAVEAIKNYITGDFENPREHRPNTCKHGTNYWEECVQCNMEHFKQALAQIEQPQKQKQICG